MTGIIKATEIETEGGGIRIPVRYLNRRIIQRTTRWFKGGLWNPGNTYYEIPGSFINITPLYDNSFITYTYMCPLGHRGAAHSISHWIFIANGQEFARHSRSVDHQESGSIQRWEVPSWGKGRSGSLGYITRQYNDSNHSVHFNGRRYDDGVDASIAVPSFVSVEEYVPAYQDPVATVVPSTGTVTEGQSVNFTVTTVPAFTGTIFYQIRSIEGTFSGSDFTDGLTSGSIAITNGSGSLSKTLANEGSIEAPHRFVLDVLNDGPSGPLIGSSSEVLVYDTPPVATITPNTSSILEGQSVTFNVSVTPPPTGTYPWVTNTSSGTITGSDFSDYTTSGTVSLVSGAGTIVRTTVDERLIGQQAYTSPGTYSWTCPGGVTSVSVVCVGGGAGGVNNVDGGGGGGGGGLGWKNNIAVTPGSNYTVVVGGGGGPGTSGGTSYFISTGTVAGNGGVTGSTTTGGAGGGFVGDGGGAGGRGGNGTGSDATDTVTEGGGGGGAGGYAGAGGKGQDTSSTLNATAGVGGAGGGGGSCDGGGYGGGGVGILGQGTNGAAGTNYTATASNGGSGGANGVALGSPTSGAGGAGGAYGGGGGGGDSGAGATGGSGAVRIIYGLGRAFPSTGTADISTTFPEGNESFSISLRDTYRPEITLGSSSVVTIRELVAGVVPNNTNANEGTTISFSVSVSEPISETLYWTTNTVSGTVNSSDFTDGQLSGSFTVTNGSGSFTRTLSNDLTTEGAESFSISVRRSNTSGIILGTSTTVNIVDTSLTPYGQTEYTSPGTFIWTAPLGVTSVSAVCIGGGGGGGPSGADASSGGGGGGLGWRNNIAVTPGSNYTVVVGGGGAVSAAGGQSYFISTGTIAGNGGSPGVNGTATGGAGGSFVGAGGGSGGQGGNSTTLDSTNSQSEAGAGGGAGGYSGAGGRGAGTNQFNTGGAGVGGAGGGGGSPDSGAAGGGGGVSIFGQGSNGAGGTGSVRGGGGSGGVGGSTTPIGGAYGGGGAGADGTTSGAGAAGAVRIIWATAGAPLSRAFPSTNTGNL